MTNRLTRWLKRLAANVRNRFRPTPQPRDRIPAPRPPLSYAEACKRLSPRRLKELAQTHYGWCPFDDIRLMGPGGLEKRVVRDTNGTFATVLPRGELIVFQNVKFFAFSEGDDDYFETKPRTMTEHLKYAATCAGEIQDAYGDWGFVLLKSLTGMEPSDAAAMFHTIQPTTFPLSTLKDELIYEAPQRMRVSNFASNPLSKTIAEDTLFEMLGGARRAFARAEKLIIEFDDLVGQQRISPFATGQGERWHGFAHAFEQLGLDLPAVLQ